MHDEITKALLEELHRRLAAPDMSHRKLEVALGLPTNELKGILDASQPRTPSVAKAKKIADALGLELYLGPPREIVPPAVAASDADYADIPLYDVGMAAGGGFSNGNEEIIGHLSFRKDWLKRIGASVTSLRVGRAIGHSMEPTIWNDDPVLIDTSKRDVPIFKPAKGLRGPIYSFLQDGEARIKRILRFESQSMMLVSDNPDYPPEPADLKRIRIIGKALWWGHTNRE